MKSGHRTNIVIVVHSVTDHITTVGIDNKSTLLVVFIYGAGPMTIWRYNDTTHSEYSSVNITDTRGNILHCRKCRQYPTNSSKATHNRRRKVINSRAISVWVSLVISPIENIFLAICLRFKERFCYSLIVVGLLIVADIRVLGYFCRAKR